jgi:hypothetical protein
MTFKKRYIMTLESLLMSLGVNLTSSFIYDKLKDFFQKQSKPSISDLKNELFNYINVENAKVVSDSIVEFLAKNGDITISGSKIFAKDTIAMLSTSGTKFQIKDGNISKTDHNFIYLGMGASITGQNGASITQSKNGISFSS